MRQGQRPAHGHGQHQRGDYFACGYGALCGGGRHPILLVSTGHFFVPRPSKGCAYHIMDVVYLWVDGAAPRAARAPRAACAARTRAAITTSCSSRCSPCTATPRGRGASSLSPSTARARRGTPSSRAEWLDQDRVLPEAVPAFNNMVLEAYLHRIPNLRALPHFNDYFLVARSRRRCTAALTFFRARAARHGLALASGCP